MNYQCLGNDFVIVPKYNYTYIYNSIVTVTSHIIIIIIHITRRL